MTRRDGISLLNLFLSNISQKRSYAAEDGVGSAAISF